MSQDQDDTEPTDLPGGDLGASEATGPDEVEADDEVEGFMFVDLKPPVLGGPPKGPSLPPSGPAGPGPSGPDTVRNPRPGRPPDPFFPT